MGDPRHLELLRSGVVRWNLQKPDWPDLRGECLDRIDLSAARLDGANFQGASLVGATLRGAAMQGVFLSGADLRDADLTDANLYYGRLLQTKLQRARLPGCKLIGATLDEAELDNANLEGANMFGAQFRGARLCDANLKSTTLIGASFMMANLSGADLSNSVLAGATFVQTDVEGATLDGAHVYGVSAWDLFGSPRSSRDLSINRAASITVSDLKVAQFMYLMLNNEHLRDVLDTITSKTVLLLGRFTKERIQVLDALRETLRQRNFVPVLFDFEKPADRDITETVTLLARMARFVIADLSQAASIPQELQAFVPDVAVPVQPVVIKGAQPWSMFRDLRRKYHWVLPPFEYQDQNHLLANLDALLAPAEAKRLELRGTVPGT